MKNLIRLARFAPTLSSLARFAPTLSTLALIAAQIVVLPLSAAAVGAQEAEVVADPPAPERQAPAAPVFAIHDGYDVDLEAYRWTHRPVVVFADSPADPRFQEQIDELLKDVPALMTRDVIVFVDTEPDRQSALRTKLRPRGFMLVLIGKDGGVKLRKPLPWSVRELSRTIDKMPMRLREVEERRGG